MSDDVPSMQISDNNGEISASVEETNRVRASLGLKPLAEGSGNGDAASKEAQAAKHGAERAAALAKESAEDAMRDKFDHARRQRLLHQKLSGTSLGEQLAGDEMDSAAAWVGKHQTQEATRKEKRKGARAQRKAGGGAAKLASQSARYDEEDEDAMGLGLAFGDDDDEAAPTSELGGTVVGHGTDDFKEGETAVLTLADQSVLGADESGAYTINEDAEMLENVNMAEEQRRQKAKAEARGDGYKYNPYVDGEAGGILGKYDEAKERQTFTLDGAGSVDDAKQKKLAAIKARLAATQGGASGTAVDVSSAGQRVVSLADGDDYQSREEVRAEQATFRKSSKEGGKEKGEKKKKMRKKVKGEGLDLDALAAATAAEGASDLGSLEKRQARQSERAAAAKDDDEARRDRFERALATAEAKSKEMEREGMEVDGANGNGGGYAAPPAAEEEEEAEVDVELYAALARARRLTGKKQPEGGHDDLAAQRVAETLAQTEAARAARLAAGAESGVELSSLEFSATGEFCKAVRSKEEMAESADLPSVKFRESMRKKEEGAGTQSAAPGGGGSSGVKREDGDRVKEDDDEEEDNEDDDDDEEEEPGDGLAMLHERKASGGLGAVLEIARNRGMIGEEGPKAGRMFDQKGAGLHAYEEAAVDKKAGGKEPSFLLEHYDEYGRKMTAKQAFRQLSWKFHGKAPSKRNREKRMLEVEKQLADQTKDKAMAYMDALQSAQQATKSAHVVLTGVHAIKPSEVRTAAAGSSAAAGGGEPKKKKAKAL